MSKFLKCACANCGGHIEFPAEGIGATIPCPHCGWQTELALETPPVLTARPKRNLKWIIAGGVILLIGVVGVTGALIVASRVMKKVRTSQASPRSVARATNAVPDTKIPSTPASKLINDFSFSIVSIEKAPSSTLAYAAGVLKNETDKQRFGVTVELDLFDKDGAKLGTAKDYVALIEPRAEWKFRALLVRRNVASAKVAGIKEQK